MQARKLQVLAPHQRHQAATRVRRKTDFNQQQSHAAATDAADSRAAHSQHSAAWHSADITAGTGRIRGTFEKRVWRKKYLCAAIHTAHILLSAMSAFKI